MRIDRGDALPGRCVVCNAEAHGHRVAAKLHWTSPGYRLLALGMPILLFAASILFRLGFMAGVAFLLAVGFAVGNYFVRETLPLELAVCDRHATVQLVVRRLLLACVIGALASGPVFAYGPYNAALTLLCACTAGMIVLALVQAFTGAGAVRVKRLTREHAWLARTGKAFRASLPELPAAS